MTTTGEVLKPCPWCPSAEQNLSSNGCDNHMVVCECGAEGPAADTPNLAVAAWNRRAPQGNAAQEWLPIESAPKDQELLLVDADGTRVVGRWGKHNHVPLYGWIRQVELYGEEVDGFDAIAYMPIPAIPSNKEVER